MHPGFSRMSWKVSLDLVASVIRLRISGRIWRCLVKINHETSTLITTGSSRATIMLSMAL